MATIAIIETFDARADGARRKVDVSHDRILISRRIAGVEMRVALAPGQFRGVLLAVLIAEETDFLYLVRLVHADPEMSVTLTQCGDERQARAHWRGWARAFRLRCLVERAEGEYEIETAAAAPVERRRGRATLRRRNRFLARRKMGRPGVAAPTH